MCLYIQWTSRLVTLSWPFFINIWIHCWIFRKCCFFSCCITSIVYFLCYLTLYLSTLSLQYYYYYWFSKFFQFLIFEIIQQYIIFWNTVLFSSHLNLLVICRLNIFLSDSRYSYGWKLCSFLADLFHYSYETDFRTEHSNSTNMKIMFYKTTKYIKESSITTKHQL